MNISFEWLKAFVPHDLSAEAVRDLLTMHVATVEGFERIRAELDPFVVGRVVESEKIPDTRLSFNKVDDGSGTLLDVVCGAPNVTVGASYPFARTGTRMPGGLVIEKRKIRGFTSNGMLCSPRELMLGDDHDGIMTLDTDAAPGTPLLDVLKLGDVRLAVDVLPNRPDLLSHLGIAREVAALTGKPAGMPAELAAVKGVKRAVRGESSESAGGVSVTIEDAADCPRYCAAIIRGVKVGPSPDWLRRRIEAVGGRSISNVVDATNYLLHGFGQPVHAFDLAKLAGAKVIVRRARPGERIVTLDGVDRALSPEVLVIGDGNAASALAGIMGGQASEVTGATTDILLEVATFSPRVVRAGRRQLGMSTDASYRFERGIDDAAVARMAALAGGLVIAVAGGVIEALIDVGAKPTARKSVLLQPTKVGKLLGDRVGSAETVKILESVGFSVAKGDAGLRVTPPSWRHDVSRDVDLVEEVARLRGYDRLPDALAGSRPSSVPDHPLYAVGVRVRDALVAAGLCEVRPLPYIASPDSGSLGAVRVRNPIGEDEPYLRTQILTTLARRAEYNLSRMQRDVRLFEIGTSFVVAASGDVREEMRVGALVMGARRPSHFTEAEPPAFDAWDAKGLAELIARAAWRGARVDITEGSAGTLWSVAVDGAARGVVRSVELDAPVWAAPAFGVEVTLGRVATAAVAARGTHDYSRGEIPSVRVPRRYVALPTTPAAEFDLALVVPDGVPATEVERLMRRTAGETLESIALFDEYRGSGIPVGTRSLAWRLTFRHPERTLRDKEVEGRRAQVLKMLGQELGISVRAG
ncbi:MAG: phenylalanine--tRNA ligase subunit beta [Gemmatimonadaceae bacterium]|nr:phenylalanine--tRNA ligase subunit beta [Gemmatimonadaceae bacterium]